MIIDLKDLESPLVVESEYMTPGCTLRDLLELANNHSFELVFTDQQELSLVGSQLSPFVLTSFTLDITFLTAQSLFYICNILQRSALE